MKKNNNMPIDTALLSTVSETDRVIFRRFCNRSKVDTDELKHLPNKIAGEGGQRLPSPKDHSPDSSAPNTPRTPKRESAPLPPRLPTTFAKQVKDLSAASPPPQYSPPRFTRAEMPVYPPPPPPPPLPFLHYPPPPPVREQPSATRITAAPSGLDAEERHKRQSGLLQLQRMEREFGVKLSREFTMDDSSDDIQFEIDFHEDSQSVRRGVAFMKVGLGASMWGLEGINERYGPVADLTGLGSTTFSGIDMYGPPLEKIYRKYWRKRLSNPISELAFLIFVTIVTTHLGNKGGPLAKGVSKMFMTMMRGNGSAPPGNNPMDLIATMLGGGNTAGGNPLAAMFNMFGGGGPAQPNMAPGFTSRVNLNQPAQAPPPQSRPQFHYAAPPPPPPQPPSQPAPSPPPPPPQPQPQPAPSAATMATPLRPPSLGSFFAKPNPPPPPPQPPAAAPKMQPRETHNKPASNGGALEGIFVFPLAGTPILTSRRGDPDSFMSLPTVMEITEESAETAPAAPASPTNETVINHRLFEDMIQQAKTQSAEVDE